MHSGLETNRSCSTLSAIVARVEGHGARRAIYQLNSRTIRQLDFAREFS